MSGPAINPVLWLEQAMAEDPGEPCPPLAGRVRADVCVVGGGLVGLWTALEVLEQAPDASVVVLDAEGCGFGASGRNGGWMTSWWDELDTLAARFGSEHGRWLAQQSSAAALVGRILGRRALALRDELTECGLVRGPPSYLPPEPLRTAGGLLVRDAVARAEAAEEAGRRPDPVTAALRRLVWFTMPRALEPRLRGRAHAPGHRL